MPWFPCPRQAGGGVLCARGLLIRTSLFPYSTVAGARALIDSQDTLPVFMATVVEDHEYNLGGTSSRRRRLSYGCSRYAHQSGYPLLISSTVALESLFERLRLSGGSFFVVKFPWGRVSDPAGVAPKPLEEFLTPSRVILPNLRKHSRCPSWKAS